MLGGRREMNVALVWRLDRWGRSVADLPAHCRLKLKGTRAMQHFCGVKVILCFPLFFAVGLWADETQDRAAIDKVIATLNDPVHRSGLFTKDADSGLDFDRLIDLHMANSSPRGVVIGMNETWTQMTEPRVVSGSIRFITRDVAIVDGASTVEGAVTLARSVPLLFVMKKEGAEWRISAVRVLTARAVVRVRVL